MKIVVILICCLCFALCTNAQRCSTADYLKLHGSAFKSVAARNEATGGRDTLKDEVIIIPVIIHVLYHNSSQNISNEQVLSQLIVLNNEKFWLPMSATTQLKEKQGGRKLTATHHYTNYRRYTGSIKVDGD